jgi:hypothetical protein
MPARALSMNFSIKRKSLITSCGKRDFCLVRLTFCLFSFVIMWLILTRKCRAARSTHARWVRRPFMFLSSSKVALLCFRMVWIWSFQTTCLYSGSEIRSCLLSSNQLRTILISSGRPSAANLDRESNHFRMMGSLAWSGRPSRQMTRGMMMESQRTLSQRSGAMPMLSSR